MLRLTTDTVIGAYRFKGFVSAEIESTYERLTDTCSLTFPRRVEWKGKAIASGAAPLLKVGDKVKVMGGYDGVNEVIFEGYIAKPIHANVPVTIDCQDAMWLLKRSTVTKSYREVRLAKLLADIMPSDVPFDAPDVSLGQFRIVRATAAQILDELRKTYALHSWIRGGKLIVSPFTNIPTGQRERRFRFNHNVIQNNLEYVREEDVRLKVKGISMLPNNKKIEFEAGDPDGEQRTMHFYNLELAALEVAVKSAIEQLRYTGYRGGFTTFLQPTMRHGDLVVLVDPVYPEREGRYRIKKVTTRIGPDGGRQEIEIDIKV